MRIHVKGNKKHNIHLVLPTGFLLNRPIAAAIAKGAREKGVPLTGKQLSILFKAIRRYRKAHKDWVLVDVQTKDGETFFIKL